MSTICQTNNFKAFRDFNLFLDNSYFYTVRDLGKTYINEEGHVVFHYIKDSYFEVRIIFKGDYKVDVEVDATDISGCYYSFSTNEYIEINNNRQFEFNCSKLNSNIDTGLKEVKNKFFTKIGQDLKFASCISKKCVKDTIIYFYTKINNMTSSVIEKRDYNLDEKTEIDNIMQMIDGLQSILNSGKD